MNRRQGELRGYTEEERRVLYGPLVYSRDGRFVIFGNKAYDEREYHSVKDLLIDEALRNGYPPSVVTNYAPLGRLRPVQVRGREHDYVEGHLEQVFRFEERLGDGTRGVMG